MVVHDIAAYRENAGLLNNPTIYLAVKSLNQLERRKRMIESKKRGTIGRIAPRPVAEGVTRESRSAGEQDREPGQRHPA